MHVRVAVCLCVYECVSVHVFVAVSVRIACLSCIVACNQQSVANRAREREREDGGEKRVCENVHMHVRARGAYVIIGGINRMRSYI